MTQLYNTPTTILTTEINTPTIITITYIYTPTTIKTTYIKENSPTSIESIIPTTIITIQIEIDSPIIIAITGNYLGEEKCKISTEESSIIYVLLAIMISYFENFF